MNGLIDAMVGSAAMGVPQNKDNSFEKRTSEKLHVQQDHVELKKK